MTNRNTEAKQPAPRSSTEVDAEIHLFTWTPDLKRVSGHIFHDRKLRFDDGDRITTSKVVRREGTIVHTKNSVYRLVTWDETWGIISRAKAVEEITPVALANEPATQFSADAIDALRRRAEQAERERENWREVMKTALTVLCAARHARDWQYPMMVDFNIAIDGINNAFTPPDSNGGMGTTASSLGSNLTTGDRSTEQGAK